MPVDGCMIRRDNRKITEKGAIAKMKNLNRTPIGTKRHNGFAAD
jgi:hypothetical protein